MDRTAAVDGFRLAYDRTGAGPAVVLLHGWPSDRTEYRNVVPLLPSAIDGRPEAVRCYLRHFWTHWSGAGFTLSEDHLEHLVCLYAEPGAFTASMGWYRVGSGGMARVLSEPVPQPAYRITSSPTCGSSMSTADTLCRWSARESSPRL